MAVNAASYFVLCWFLAAIARSHAVFIRNDLEEAAGPVPIVLWHGMGDTCCARGIGGIQKILETNISGVFVHSVEIGNNEEEDFTNSYFKAVNTQIDIVCKNLSQLPQLANGYHAVGFSQGGQFLRGLAQRCPNPRMKNLISFGGQHQGVFGLPRCPGSATICTYVRKLLDMGAYTNFVQSRLVQAQYWHDSLNEATYRKKSLFLADINNEVVKNQDYKKNLQQLQKFVMVKFLKDTMVVPKESEWFGYYCPGQTTNLCALQNSTLYHEDWLGLKAMDAAGKLVFLEAAGDHLQFTTQWFLDNIVTPYLR